MVVTIKVRGVWGDSSPSKSPSALQTHFQWTWNPTNILFTRQTELQGKSTSSLSKRLPSLHLFLLEILDHSWCGDLAWYLGTRALAPNPPHGKITPDPEIRAWPARVNVFPKLYLKRGGEQANGKHSTWHDFRMPVIKIFGLLLVKDLGLPCST